MSNRTWRALGLFAVAVFACAAASAAMAGDAADGTGSGGAKGGDRAERRAAVRERARQGETRRREASTRLLESLQATDEQRALVLAKAKSAAPILADARRQARALVAQAMASVPKGASKADRKAARDSVKPQILTIRGQARGQVDALAKDVVASLTTEQRARLQELVGRRGKPLDDARLTRLAAALISRPSTASRLEAPQAK